VLASEASDRAGVATARAAVEFLALLARWTPPAAPAIAVLRSALAHYEHGLTPPPTAAAAACALHDAFPGAHSGSLFQAAAARRALEKAKGEAQWLHASLTAARERAAALEAAGAAAEAAFTSAASKSK
jgi:hypothetical protein